MIDLKPRTLDQVRAGCGCKFEYVLRQCFDAATGRWGEACYLIGEPCSDAHREIAEESAEVARRQPATRRTLDLVLAKLASRTKAAA